MKNNFKLSVGDTIDKHRVLQLVGPGVSIILRKVNLKSSNAVLGWLQADRDEFIVIYSTDSRSFPSEQPLTVHVYEKVTGKLLIQGPLLSYDEQGNAILFINFDKQEQLGLFDLISKEIEYFPAVNTQCKSWWWCITRYEVTEEEVTLDFHDAIGYTQRKKLKRSL